MNIHNEKGFSLIQIVIAAGLMGMLSLYMLKMQQNQMMNQNKILMDTEILQFMNKLNGFFDRSEYCEKNLMGKSVIDAEGFELLKFEAPNGRTLFEKGQLYGNRTFELESIQKSDFFFDTKDKRSGNLTLTITLKKHKKSFGSDHIKKKLDLMVYLDEDGVINSCSSNSFSGVGAGANTNIKTEDIRDVVSWAVKDKDAVDEKTEKKYEDIQKTIESNPALKELQKSIQSLQKSNEELEKLNFD